MLDPLFPIQEPGHPDRIRRCAVLVCRANGRGSFSTRTPQHTKVEARPPAYEPTRHLCLHTIILLRRLLPTFQTWPPVRWDGGRRKHARTRLPSERTRPDYLISCPRKDG